MRERKMTDHKTRKLSIQSFVRKAGRMMLAIISIVLAGILVLEGVLFAWSYPGKPKPFTDEN